jgi:protein TonB
MQQFRISPTVRNLESSGVQLPAGPAPEFSPHPRLIAQGFWRNLRDAIAPPQLPPLKVSSKPVAVRPLFAKDRLFGRSQAVSLGLHALLAVLILVPIAHTIQQKAQSPSVDVTYLPSSYPLKLPAGKDIARGGGGGGERMPEPPSRGKLPRWSMTQITPPMAVPRNPDPKLPSEPTLLGPPDLKAPSTNDANFGDPLAAILTASSGPGSRGGIGNGANGGIGDGDGPGFGPGSDGGYGGQVFRAGTDGVGIVTCLYCPPAQYSEDARKAKYQGVVMLQFVVTPDGRATGIEIVKGPGLGLEEKAIEAVRTWKFKPAIGRGGKPVAALTTLEVTFRLL